MLAAAWIIYYSIITWFKACRWKHGVWPDGAVPHSCFDKGMAHSLCLNKIILLCCWQDSMCICALECKRTYTRQKIFGNLRVALPRQCQRPVPWSSFQYVGNKRIHLQSKCCWPSYHKTSHSPIVSLPALDLYPRASYVEAFACQLLAEGIKAYTVLAFICSFLLRVPY